MKIGVDAGPLVGQRTGIASYLSGLLAALANEDPGHEFILYAPRPLAFHPPDARWRTRVYPGIKGTKSLWLQFYGRWLAQRDQLDLFWGAHFLLPPGLGPRIAAVVTVYDLVPFLFPQTMELKNYLVKRLLIRPSLARAHHVCTISQSTALDLQQRLGVPREKISVVPPGVAAQFAPRDPAQARRRVASALGLAVPYVLILGTVEPRKNLITALRAFASLPAAMRREWTLVVAGATGWKSSSIHAAAEALVREGTVRFLGYVPDAELPWLYAGATLLLFPSLYEGFGMPVIEAMASGCPVVASDIPVTREVAADAAVFVPPPDVAGWAGTIERMVDDEVARAGLRERGLERAKRFTFASSARRLLTVCERVHRNRQDAFRTTLKDPGA